MNQSLKLLMTIVSVILIALILTQLPTIKLVLLSMVGLAIVVLFLLFHPRFMVLKRMIRAKLHRKQLLGLVLVLILGVGLWQVSHKVTELENALLPPLIPDYHEIKQPVEWLAQNWDEATRTRFHYTSQGTQTMPIPYEWFIHLEQPATSLLSVAASQPKQKFSDPDYLARMGFIPPNGDINENVWQKKYNPDGLSIGIVKSSNIHINGLSGKRNAVGFTCAACHTGTVTYNDKTWGIDGGAANVDMGLLQNALAKALAQTIVSSQLPVFNDRFENFAKNVLGKHYNPSNRQRLMNDLMAFASNAAKAFAEPVAVTEGFSRLDALNRIGNQVFGHIAKREENITAINAPVNYPHIWTASWFDWVQYDGSIMNPLVRNVGEALGVNAMLNLTANQHGGRFSSSVPINELAWMETALAGQSLTPRGMNDGLIAPKWSEAFGATDHTLVSQGERLYQTLCASCHLPPLESIITDPNYLKPITWKTQDGQIKRTNEQVLHVNIVPHEIIGTDPAQGKILATRTVNTAGTVDNPSQIDQAEHPTAAPMHINATVCTPLAQSPYAPHTKDQHEQLTELPFKDSPQASFALALGAIVDETVDAWVANNPLYAKDEGSYRTERPNCLQAGKGYKARPLNGIWATAPYLHNGSVASLWDLLSSAEERPTVLKLGHNVFDPKKVGIAQDKHIKLHKHSDYAKDGTFLLDTRVLGNHNTGHSFSATNPDVNTWEIGVIGRKLSDEEKWALIEYLKTL
ncbi:MAG: di-heme-cytochrome C peroxidase [bacterium]